MITDDKPNVNLASQVTRYLPEIEGFEWSQSIDESIIYLESGGINFKSRHAEKYAEQASKDAVLIAFYALYPKICAGFFQGVASYRAMKYFERLRELTNQKERAMVLSWMYEDDAATESESVAGL